ncbi:S-adenosyl-L-methionine-dependent methyltransferase [Dactylonectria estremocensis]|uniref:S-adenosyl-L-methionine-dependent methyltransferase n=1 Tax=Dactylonectria estremocensis TaxID=1079267 RepID=A0A9P9F0I2_9HYPO|nr:S-adenosyl-L-methionine-dependent methyltransferase [Dactylonectria estremocensis]
MSDKSKETSPTPVSPKDSPKDSPTRTSALLPPQHWADTAEGLSAADDDADSALGDVESSTASISSSILQYRTIHGRRFHSEQGDAHYWGPNDERHSESADINHHVQTLGLDGKLFLAPLDRDKVKKVVDIGTGTDLCSDFADEFPGAEVIGTDISPIQPSWVPPNLQFEMDDCTKDWTFAPESLDYVHIRFLSGCIADWTALFKQAYRCLKPGGIIETMEPSANMESDDGSVEETSAMGQWGKIFIEGGQKIGRTFTVYQDNTQNTALEEAGFVDLHVHTYKSPIGGWPKDEKLREIGQYVQLTMESDFEGIIVFMTSVLGNWTKEEVQVYIAHLRREIRDKEKHAWFWQKIVWARKPE